MGNFLLRCIVNGVALVLTSQLLPGMSTNGGLVGVLVIGLVFGIVNAVIKPIVKFVSFPLIIVTLGLFILVINGLMLWLTSSIAPNYLSVSGFGTAVLGGIVMGIINMILEAITGVNKE
jgi:putative membrane protein